MSQQNSGERLSYERVVARLHSINEVTTTLTQSFDLEHTLDDILDRVLEVLSMEVGAVFLLNPEEQGLTLLAHRNLPKEVLDCANGTRAARMLARNDELLCKLAGPLRAKGEVNGLLFVGDRVSCPILRQEVELLDTICSIMGVFVDNVRLYQDRTRQLQIERAVLQVAEEVTTELELDRVLPKVMEIAVGVTATEGGVVALLDEERSVITYPYLHQLPQDLAEVTVAKGEGLSGEVMTTGQPTIIDNYQAYPRSVPAFAEAGLASVAVVPIVSGDRTFGALSVLSLKARKSFSDREIAILIAIGRQAGIAIENAYLYENMRFYARKITQAQENERKRIARELHDDTIQSLIALSRRTEALLTSGEALPTSIAGRIQEMQDQNLDIIRRVRRFSQDLRPSILDDLGLFPALQELTTELDREHGLVARFHIIGEERRLSSDVELTLFRIAQEALNNVRRHADASSVVTTVEISESAVRMMIEDDGKGFKPPSFIEHPVAGNKLGLIGMQERTRLLGGMLVVNSAPGRGTKIIVNVPV
ncbi:MAG: GAF domain-containing protein [Anaerolineae bacterium]